MHRAKTLGIERHNDSQRDIWSPPLLIKLELGTEKHSRVKAVFEQLGKQLGAPEGPR
jgi:hypothetical protein